MLCLICRIFFSNCPDKSAPPGGIQSPVGRKMVFLMEIWIHTCTLLFNSKATFKIKIEWKPSRVTFSAVYFQRARHASRAIDWWFADKLGIKSAVSSGVGNTETKVKEKENKLKSILTVWPQNIWNRFQLPGKTGGALKLEVCVCCALSCR